MKIAMIGHKRVIGREGGIEVVVEELSTRLVEEGHEVVCFDRKKHGFKSPKIYKGIQIKPTFTISRKSTDALVCSFISSIKVLFGKYDIIHYHGIGPSIFLVIPHLFKKRVIVTVHGLNYKTPKWKGLGAKMMKLGEKITAKYADEIIVLSYEQKKYFKDKYNRNTIYIPNGVSITHSLVPNIIKDKYSLFKNSYILYLSRIVPGKGIEYLLDAYNSLNLDIPLIIAGGTEFVDDFYNSILEKASINPNIKFIGFVSGNELIELYSNTNLFIFPSEAEGMPMCLLEAMSLNVRCLASDIPENKEVGKNYIEYFESKNVNDLKNKLLYCLNHYPEKNTVNYIEKNYSWKNVTKKTIDVYTSVKEVKKCN